MAALDFPASPALNATYSANNNSWKWDGTSWVSVSENGVIISDTAPTSPVSGTEWWDSSIGRLFIYYSDGTSSQWVGASPSIVGPSGTNGTNGTTYTTISDVQLGSLGIGTPASGVSGEIRAANGVTAFYSSDYRLKENITLITNPLEKIQKIRQCKEFFFPICPICPARFSGRPSVRAP